jgi:magnesium-transporting ATPase (P-type)
MTVILRQDDGRIKVLCKGADSIIIPRLANTKDPLIETTMRYLNEYANTGLRTLLLSERFMSEIDYEAWEEKYHTA